MDARDIAKELQNLVQRAPAALCQRLAAECDGSLERAITAMISEIDDVDRAVMGSSAKRSAKSALNSKLKDLAHDEALATVQAQITEGSRARTARKARQAEDLKCDAATVAHYAALAAKDGPRRPVGPKSAKSDDVPCQATGSTHNREKAAAIAQRDADLEYSRIPISFWVEYCSDTGSRSELAGSAT